MPSLIETPTRVAAAGQPGKLIDEHIGRVNSEDHEVSIAHMRSPSGWSEPGQRPEFDEYTIVLRGQLVVEHESGRLEVGAGQTVHATPGEWVRYSTPLSPPRMCTATRDNPSSPNRYVADLSPVGPRR